MKSGKGVIEKVSSSNSRKGILVLLVATLMVATAFVPFIQYNNINAAKTNGTSTPAFGISKFDPYRNITNQINHTSGSLPNQWIGDTISTPYGFMTVGGNGFVLFNTTTNSTYSGFLSGYIQGVAFHNGVFVLVGTSYWTSSAVGGGEEVYLYYPQNSTLRDITGTLSGVSPGLGSNSHISKVDYYNGSFYMIGQYRNTGGGGIGNNTATLFYSFNPSTLTFVNLSSVFNSILINDIEMISTPDGLYIMGVLPSSAKAELFQYNTNTLLSNRTSSLPNVFQYSGIYTSFNTGADLYPSSNMVIYNGTLLIAGDVKIVGPSSTYYNLSIEILSESNGNNIGIQEFPGGQQGYISSISADGSTIFISGLMNFNNGTYFSPTPMLYTVSNFSATSATFTNSSYLMHVNIPAEFIAGGNYGFEAGGRNLGKVSFGLVTLTPEASLTVVESGLPANAMWYATVNGTTKATYGPSLQFNLAPGGYTVTGGSVLTYYTTSPVFKDLNNTNNYSLSLVFSKIKSKSSELVQTGFGSLNSLNQFTNSSYFGTQSSVFYNTLQTLVAMSANGSSYNPELAAFLPTTSNGGINTNSYSYNVAAPWGATVTENVAPYENYTFYLSQNNFWQNGSVVSAFDVAYTVGAEMALYSRNPSTLGWLLSEYMLPNGGYGTGSFFNVSQAVSFNSFAHSVTFHFVQPMTPDLVYSIFSSAYAFILDPQWIYSVLGLNNVSSAWSNYGLNLFGLTSLAAVMQNSFFSDGPYELAKYLPANAVILKANPYFKSPGSFDPAPAVNSTAMLFTLTPNLSIAQMNSGVAQIMSSFSVPSKYSNNNTYTVGGRSQNLYGFYFNANISTTALSAYYPGENIPYNMFSNLDARKAMTDAFNYSIISTVNTSSQFGGFYANYGGFLPYNFLSSNSRAQISGYAVQNLSRAESEWSTFIGSSQATANNLIYNGSKYSYHGKPIVIPIILYSGDKVDTFIVNQWNNTVSSIFPGVSIVPVSGSPWNSFIPGQVASPIIFTGWAPDYNNFVDYLTPFLSQFGTWRYMSGLSSSYVGSTSNSFNDQRQANQLLNLTDYVNAAEYTGNQSTANTYANDANVLGAKLDLMVPSYAVYAKWYLSNNISTTNTQYELNPYLLSNSFFLFAFVKYKSSPQTYGVNVNPTGLYDTYNNLQVAGGSPQYYFSIANHTYNLNSLSGSNYTSSLTISLPNGTYSYTYWWDYSSMGTNATFRGSLTVAGSAVSLTLNFSRNSNGQTLYPVRLMESSLPVDDSFYTSMSSALDYPGSYTLLLLTNGTYSVLVDAVNNPYTYYDNFTVSGTPLNSVTDFSRSPTGAALYPVMFDNQNVPSYSITYVSYSSSTVSGTGQITPGQTIYLYLPNGTYNYINALNFTFSENVTGTFTVAGQPVTVTDSFSQYYTYNVTFFPLVYSFVSYTVTIGNSTYNTSIGSLTIGLHPGSYDAVISMQSGYSTFSNIYFTVVNSNINENFPVFFSTSGINPLLQYSGPAESGYTISAPSNGELLIAASVDAPNVTTVTASQLGVYLNGIYYAFNASTVDNSVYYLSGMLSEHVSAGSMTMTVPYAVSGSIDFSVYELSTGYSVNFTSVKGGTSALYPKYLMPFGYQYYLFTAMGYNPGANNGSSFGAGMNLGPYNSLLSEMQGYTQNNVIAFNGTISIPVLQFISVAISSVPVVDYGLTLKLVSNYSPLSWLLRITEISTNFSEYFSLTGTSGNITLYGLSGKVSYALSVSDSTVSPASGTVDMNKTRVIDENVTLNNTIVYVKENGVPVGDTWSVTVGNVTYYSTQAVLNLSFTPSLSVKFSFAANGYEALPGTVITNVSTVGTTIEVFFENSSFFSIAQVSKTISFTTGNVNSGMVVDFANMGNRAYVPFATDASGETVYVFSLGSNGPATWLTFYSLNLSTYVIQNLGTYHYNNSAFMDFAFDSYNNLMYLMFLNLSTYVVNLGAFNINTDTYSNVFSTAASVNLLNQNHVSLSFAGASDNESVFIMLDDNLYSVLPNSGYSLSFETNLSSSGTFAMTGMAYDPLINRIIAVGIGSSTNELLQVNPNTGSVLKVTYSVFSNPNGSGLSIPQSVFYLKHYRELAVEIVKSSSSDVYLLNASSLTVLNSKTFSGMVAFYTMAYNPLNSLYYAGFIASSWEVIVFNRADSVSYPVIPVYFYPDVYSSFAKAIIAGSEFRSVYYMTTSVNTTGYNLVFTETGLIAGTQWGVTVSGQEYLSTGTSIVLSVPNGVYAYSIIVPVTYMATVSSGNVTVNGNNVTVNTKFNRIVYTILITESGLSGGIWYVNVSGMKTYSATSGSGITVSLWNGNYTLYVSSTNENYTASNVSFFVSGSNKTVQVNFTLLLYAVTIYESGLPANTEWFVTTPSNITYSTYGNNLTFDLQNGFYTLTMTTVATSYRTEYSNVTVAGASVSLTVFFTQISPGTLKVHASPPFATVTVNSYPVGLDSTGNASLSLAQGTYYVNASASGYIPFTTVITISSGSVYYLNITLTQLYQIVFQETGLPSGAAWNVTLTGTSLHETINSTTDYIVFNNLNGNGATYSYVVMEYLNASSATRYVLTSNRVGSILIGTSNIGVSELYAQQFYVDTSVSPLNSGTVSPVSGWYNANSTVTLTVTAAGHYAFEKWTGSGFGSYSGTGNNVQMNIVGAITEIAVMQNAYLINFTESNLPAGMEWFLNFTNGSSYHTTATYISLYLLNGSYSYTFATPGHIYHSPAGTVTVSGLAESVSVNFIEQTYAVTFTESGLPTGTTWYVNITGLSPISSTVNTITVQLSNGSYTYTISTVNKDYATTSSGSFSVKGASGSETITFLPVLYTVTFTESGLPSGTTWYVNITGQPSQSSTTSTISIKLQNGTYAYTVATLNKKFGPTSYTGSLTVAGTSASKSVAFNPITYKVTFTESNLPAGTEWFLNFTSGTAYHTTTSTISVSLQNGSYSYTLSTVGHIYHSPKGTVTVTGSPGSVSVPFTEQTYAITFTETGLPAGTTWWVNTTSGSSLNSASNTIIMQLSNGSYTYSVSTTYKLMSSKGGSFSITGAASSIAVHFRLVNYTVTVTESGLPSGTYWYFNITGMNSLLLSKASFSVQLHNGTYSYTAQSTDKSFTPLAGTLTVSGSSLYIGVFFTSVSPGTIKFSLNPTYAELNVNGYIVQTSGGSATMSLQPGTYYINVSFAGYKSDSIVVKLKSNEVIYENITLIAVTTYGYLTGTVSPSNATIVASGVDVLVVNGSFNQTLATGIYYVDISAPGYSSQVIQVTITKGKTTALNAALVPTPRSYTISGYVMPENASITLDGYIAYVSSNGFYKISLPNGTYELSAYAYGYYPFSVPVNLSGNVIFNITLQLAPPPTSTTTVDNVTVTGYNVTLGTVNVSSLQISVNFTGKTGGKLIVDLPYSQVKDETISQLLASKVYVNGILKTNYTITISSNYTVILTVDNVTGDPTMTWAIASNAPVTNDYMVLFNETGLPSGDQWYVNLSNGEKLVSSTNSIEVGLANGTYTFVISSANSNYSLIRDINSGTSAYGSLTGTVKVSGGRVYVTLTFVRTEYAITIHESGLPTGTTWSSTVNGIQFSSSTDIMLLNVKVGSYTITADNTTSYYSDTFSKVFSVSSGNITVDVTYTHFAYLNIKLSPGNATVTLNGKVVSHSGSVLNITLPAGSYTLKVTDKGYLTYYNNFTLNQNGKENLNVTLQLLNQPSVTGPNPLTSGYTLYIIIGVVVVVLAIIGLAVSRRKK